MPRRTRIINDPSELVPLLQTFRSKDHKKVFNALTDDWKTTSELKNEMGFEVTPSIEILKQCGLVESQWHMPEPGQTPEKEYRSSYSKVHANFQCSLDDLSEILMLTFTPYEEIESFVNELETLVVDGNHSMSSLTRALNKSALHVRSLAQRSSMLSVMGQRLKINENQK